MASISSLGIGSGVLTSSLVDKLVQAQKKPENNRLNQQKTQIKNKVSDFGKLQSAVTDLRLPARALGEPGALLSYTINASGGITGTVTDNSSVQPGQYQLSVDHKAQAQSLATDTQPDANTTTLGTGKLTLKVGSQSKTIKVDNTDNTLEGLASAINNSGVDVNATVVNTGSGYRMVLSSRKTGTANAIQVSTQDSDGNNTDNSGLSQLAYNSNTKNLTQTVAAKDAKLSVNGIDVTKSSNQVSGVIPGVKLNLAGARDNSTTLLQVSQNTQAATKRVQNLVDAYNKLQSLVAKDTKYDASTQTAGPLLGDSTVNSIMNQVREKMHEILPGRDGSAINSLAEVGLSTDPHTGQISLNKAKFEQALKAHPQDVAALFGNHGTTTDSQVKFLTGSVDSKAGTYAINVKQAATQGVYKGGKVIANNTVIDSSNNAFTIKVNSGTSAKITLDQATYANPKDLVNQIQAQLNSNKALKASGLHVTVGLDSQGQLLLTSETYGSSSQIAITSGDSALGLASGQGSNGTDVQGTINGHSASGTGQVLTGKKPDNSAGIAVKVTGSATGNRGKVTYSQGVGTQLVNLINGFLSNDGLITDKNSYYQKRLADISKQEQKLNDRITAYQNRLKKEFTAEDAKVAKLNNTMSFLKAQMGALSGGGGNSAGAAHSAIGGSGASSGGHSSSGA